MILHKRTPLSHERLTSILDYNPNTGIVRWKVTSSRAKPGAVAGYLSAHGYQIITIGGKKYFAHRIAWFYITGQWPEHYLDHINGCRSDNRLENLRPANYSQNQANRRLSRNNRSGFTGAHYNRRLKKWIAAIGGKKNRKTIGCYATPYLAAQAYAKAAVERWGYRCRPDTIALAKVSA